MKNLFKRAYSTNLGRFLSAIIIMVVGGIMSPNGAIGEWIYDWDQGAFWTIMFYIGLIGTVGQSLVWIAFGVIINPLKNWIHRN